MTQSQDDKGNTSPNSTDILSLIDGFIEQISGIKSILKGVSVSALILAPLAIALSAFLITHSSFFTILQREYDFGFVLILLLASVIAISSVWIISGLRQYRMISEWNKRYANYLTNKEEIRKTIESEYSFSEDSEN